MGFTGDRVYSFNRGGLNFFNHFFLELKYPQTMTVKGSLRNISVKKEKKKKKEAMLGQ